MFDVQMGGAHWKRIIVINQQAKIRKSLANVYLSLIFSYKQKSLFHGVIGAKSYQEKSKFKYFFDKNQKILNTLTLSEKSEKFTT